MRSMRGNYHKIIGFCRHGRRHMNAPSHFPSLTLADVPQNSTVQVMYLEMGRPQQRRLNQLGIRVGEKILVKTGGAFHGPILIEHNSNQVAIGRGMARKILVQLLERYEKAK